MSILQILMGLVAIGVLTWLVMSFVPMDPTIKGYFRAVVIIGTTVWLLWVFGFLDALGRVHVPRG